MADKVDYTGAKAQEYLDKYTNRPEDWNNTWENVGEKLHMGLGMAGMVPGIGNVADIIDAGLYASEGDKLGTGLALASAIPFAGLFTGAGKLGKAAKGDNFDLYHRRTDPNTGFYSIRKKASKEIDDMALKTSKVPKELAYGDRLKFLHDSSHEFGRKFLKHRFSKVDEGLVGEARSFLEKELLSDESYTLWAKMMKKGHNVHVANQGKPGFLIKKDKPNISREHYEKVVKDKIANTPVYSVPRDELALLKGNKDTDRNTRGLYNKWYNSVMIPEGVELTTLRGKTTLVHELKHSVQEPFQYYMDLAYGDALLDANRKFRRAKLKSQNVGKARFDPDLMDELPLQDLERRFNQPVSEFTEYVRTPSEVSARLSEVRTGILGEKGGYPITELSEAFHPKQIKGIKKSIWAAAPAVPIMTAEERLKKAFGEEE